MEFICTRVSYRTNVAWTKVSSECVCCLHPACCVNAYTWNTATSVKSNFPYMFSHNGLDIVTTQIKPTKCGLVAVIIAKQAWP